MPGMTPSRVRTLRLPQEIDDALSAWCEANGCTLSQLLIAGALDKIGQPGLIEHVRERGYQPPAAPAKPSKKKRGG